MTKLFWMATSSLEKIIVNSSIYITEMNVLGIKLSLINSLIHRYLLKTNYTSTILLGI